MTIRKGAEDGREQDYKSDYKCICTNCENITNWLKSLRSFKDKPNGKLQWLKTEVKH